VTRGTSQIRVLFCLWLTAVGRTATFALARVLALATVVASLTAALSLTVILALTRVLTLLSFQRLDGNACFGWSGAGGISASGYRSGKKTGDSGTGNNCFRWFDHC
jgi:hypothetical protein